MVVVKGSTDIALQTWGRSHVGGGVREGVAQLRVIAEEAHQQVPRGAAVLRQLGDVPWKEEAVPRNAGVQFADQVGNQREAYGEGVDVGLEKEQVKNQSYFLVNNRKKKKLLLLECS